jgi:hypothetical protein
MLAKVLGRVTGLVLINTFELEEILQREGAASPIRDLVLRMERRRAGSIYPHLIYPIRAEPWQFAGARQTDPANRPAAIQQHHVRGNRFVSSPFLRAELYGGNETRALIQTLLSNSSARDAVRAQEMSYIERQKSLDDGLGALVKVLQGGANGHTVMQETFPAW